MLNIILFPFTMYLHLPHFTLCTTEYFASALNTYIVCCKKRNFNVNGFPLEKNEWSWRGTKIRK